MGYAPRFMPPLAERRETINLDEVRATDCFADKTIPIEVRLREYAETETHEGGESAVVSMLIEAADRIKSFVTRQPNLFVEHFSFIAEEVGRVARSKGWWDKDRNDGELIALMHSELSEALEALRHGNPPDDKIPEFTGVEGELADVIIRIMDFAANKKHRVAEALIAKIRFNQSREFMHGGKRF